MKIMMVPMHDDLAVMGVCTWCFQGFGADRFYFQVVLDEGAPQDPVEVRITCLGCAALFACAG